MFSSKKYFLLVALILVLTVFSSGCADVEDDEGAEASDTIVFGYTDWDSFCFNNEVAMFITRHGYGYETESIQGSTPANLLGLVRGDINVRMENWVDTYGDEYFGPVAEGDIIEIGINFDDNMQGLYVPAFVIKGDSEKGIEPIAPDLRAVEDLPEYWELFKDPEDPDKGRIYGSPVDWTTDEILRAKVEFYGLEDTYNYFPPGSDTALAVAIASHIDRGQPILAYYWEPTWLLGKYDMILLDEPEYNEEDWLDGYKTAFPSTDVTIVVNKGFPEEFPEVADFLSKYRTSSSLLNEVLAYMQINEVEAKEAAIWFLNEYEDIWHEWVPQDVAEKVKAGL